MENKIAQAPEHTTNLIRMEVNQIMLEAIKEIKNKPLPKPSEFTTKEEYQRAWNQYQHQVIQYVKNIKTNIFHQALANYDGVTDDKKEIDELTRKQRMITESITTINDSRVKREVIKIAALSLLFPQYAPVFIMLDMPVILYYLHEKEYSNQSLQNYIETRELVHKSQDSLYEIINIIREDYHSTLSQLHELGMKVENGEPIIEEAISCLNPNILEGQPKVYTKEKV